MKYYMHHIGDFKKDTSYLTHKQRSIYLEMLWLYYDEERPLPKDKDLIALKVKATVEEVELLLSLYFDEDHKCFRHKRIDEELEKTYEKSEIARAKANKRWNNATAMPQHTSSSADAMQPNTHNPIPNTHIYTADRFDEFWNVLMPTRRVNKKGCLDKWKKHNLDKEADTILKWYKIMKNSKQWKDGYNPSPEVIINQRRWEDGIAENTIREIIL